MSTTLGENSKIKIAFRGETRKVSSVKSYNELSDMICQIFLISPNSFKIKYKDEDDDLVSIDNQEAFLTAIDDFENSKKSAIKFFVEDQVDSIDYSIIRRSEIQNPSGLINPTMGNEKGENSKDKENIKDKKPLPPNPQYMAPIKSAFSSQSSDIEMI